MTYEEAINCIKWNICYKQEVCKDGICKSTEDRPCAIDVAIDCIEKQIPKKPILVEDKMYTCGYCYNNLQYKYKKYPDELNGRGFNFCSCCGQRIDWSEVK